MQSGALEAKWIVSMEDEPVFKDARITFEKGIIKTIEEAKDGEGGNTLLLPGFINLHSHLDYSDAQFYKAPLFDWIEKLVLETSRNWNNSKFAASALHGSRLALSTGTTFIVDSSYSGASAIAMAQTGLKGIVGLEVFGVNSKIAGIAFDAWKTRFETVSEELQNIPGSKNIELTISPHAPYTVSPDLFKLVQDWARKNKSLVLTHLAESSEENRWFNKGCDRLDSYLKNVLPPSEKSNEEIVEEIDWSRNGKTSTRHLFDHDLLDENVLAAHCIEISSDDLALLKDSKIACAHCPRSNFNLQNGSMKLKDFLDNAIPLGLGTDSLASTETLSLLDEAKFAFSMHQNTLEKCAYRLLRLITIDSARAISMDHEIGSIKPGKKADLVELESKTSLENLDNEEIYQHIICGNCRVKAVYINGEKISSKA